MSVERSGESLFFAPSHEKQHFSERSGSGLLPSPPPTNRGVIMTDTSIVDGITVRPDYMTGTSKMSLDEVKNYLSSVLGAVDWVEVSHGGYGYKHIAMSAYGVRIYYTEGREDILVWVPGKACEYLGDAGVWATRSYLDLKLTRLDLAWDRVGVSPYLLRDSFKASQYSSRVRANSCKWIEDGDGFQTFYIGSGHSLRTLVCYNRRGYNRLELRLRDDYAQATAQTMEYLYEEKDRIEFYLSLVTGYIDFVDRQVDTNVSRCPRLDWWADFVGSVDKMRFALEKKVQHAQEFVNNVIGRMSASVATAAQILAAQSSKNPLDVLTELFHIGLRKQKPKHKVLLGYFNTAQPYVPF
jgi:hypothetical protein